jgi:hypothetical protein
MKVYLVQHGEAKPKSIDPTRPLTERGHQDAQHVAAFAERLGLEVRQIRHIGSATSPTSDLWYNFTLAAPVLQDRVARGDSLHTGEVSVQPH